MRHQGLIALGLLSGIALLEAWQGHYLTVALWLGVGMFLAAMDRPAKTHHRTPGHTAHH